MLSQLKIQISVYVFQQIMQKCLQFHRINYANHQFIQQLYEHTPVNAVTLQTLVTSAHEIWSDVQLSQFGRLHGIDAVNVPDEKQSGIPPLDTEQKYLSGHILEQHAASLQVGHGAKREESQGKNQCKNVKLKKLKEEIKNYTLKNNAGVQKSRCTLNSLLTMLNPE